LPADTICAGNPAVPKKPRRYRDPDGGR
jgi:hypothetical protein